MQKSIINEQMIQAEIVVETPLRSLRTSGHVKTQTSHGLVRLTSSSGRLPTVTLTPKHENRPGRPQWRTLRQRAKATTTAVVSA
ncbi:MAG: hypothetical protein QF885_03420 [Candidatus Thalassarchaeaceae archaeon]|nr:hypothetical protein [Candidatus Thalassarchaeaceae archaeon]